MGGLSGVERGGSDAASMDNGSRGDREGDRSRSGDGHVGSAGRRAWREGVATCRQWATEARAIGRMMDHAAVTNTWERRLWRGEGELLSVGESGGDDVARTMGEAICCTPATTDSRAKA